MTSNDISLLDRQLKGITLRLMWGLVVYTAISVSAVLSVYYGLRNDLALQKLEIQLLHARMDKIESANLYSLKGS